MSSRYCFISGRVSGVGRGDEMESAACTAPTTRVRPQSAMRDRMNDSFDLWDRSVATRYVNDGTGVDDILDVDPPLAAVGPHELQPCRPADRRSNRHFA